MRVSEQFNLGRTQPTLDFVDVDVRRDTRVFVDPRAIRLLRGQWGDQCVSLVQDFFTKILVLISDGKDRQAVALLSALREPNETHRGLSRGRSHGHPLGPTCPVRLRTARRPVRAIPTGLLHRLAHT